MVRMVRNRAFHISYKMGFGLLGLSALITEIVVTVERGTFNPANFFSYFTIEANIIVAAVLLLSAITTALGKNAKLDVLRSAATVYISIVGIGFSILLSGLSDVEFTAVPWDNFVLHYIMPMAMIGDLLLDRPRRKIALKTALLWLLFPVTYLIYSLIRGMMVGWYPYPFLNPATNGYEGIVATSIGLLVLGFGLAVAATRLAKPSSDRAKKA